MVNQAHHVARNVPREVAQLSPSGLITYVADRITDLGWSVTPHAQRQVFTLEAFAPRGQRIIVDVRPADQSGQPTPLDAVQRLLAAKTSLRADLSVLLSGSPLGFTIEARDLAVQHGLTLWTLEELQLLADAAATGDHRTLPGLGLEAPQLAVAPPNSSSAPSVSVPRVKRFDALIIGATLAVVIALLVVIFKPFQSAGTASSSDLVAPPASSTPLTASPGVPTIVPEPLTSSSTVTPPDSTTPTSNAAGVLPDPNATPTTVSSVVPTTTDPELEREAIRDLLVRWNELYKTALETNDERGLLPFIDGEQRTGLITRFSERRRDRCILSIEERRQYQQGDVLLASDSSAKTSITRDVAYVERCAGKEARTVRDGSDVNVEYTLEKRSGAWIILDSVTTGGAVKPIAKPAAPKNPVLMKVDCNGEPFLIAGRENVECSATFVYTPNPTNALLGVEGQVLIDEIRDGMPNKYVAADVNGSKDDSTLLFAPLGDGRVEIYVNWLISVPANSSNGTQTQARAKLKFNFADDSAYRPKDLVIEIK